MSFGACCVGVCHPKAAKGQSLPNLSDSLLGTCKVAMPCTCTFYVQKHAVGPMDVLQDPQDAERDTDCACCQLPHCACWF